MNISITPIGIVSSLIKETSQMPISGTTSRIIVNQNYIDGLLNINYNSHLWILCWFHEAKRDQLISRPKKTNSNAEPFGVFALRSPTRPNPIALTLVTILAIEGNQITVSGLDAVDGTPVLDIKPYYEKDTMFAPKTPYIRPMNSNERLNLFRELAVKHHGEICKDLEIAVEMAFHAEALLGNLFDNSVKLHVKGSSCLGDSLQAITRAKLGNPERFSFEKYLEVYTVTWTKGNQSFSTNYKDAIGVNVT